MRSHEASIRFIYPQKTFTLSPTSPFLLIFIRKECEWFVFQVFTTHRWLREKGVKG